MDMNNFCLDINDEDVINNNEFTYLTHNSSNQNNNDSDIDLGYRNLEEDDNLSMVDD